MAPFEKIVDQIRGVFKLGGRFGGPPDKVPPGGEGLLPESVPTRFETVATPLVSARFIRHFIRFPVDRQLLNVSS